VAAVSSRSLSDRVPRSGLASTAMTRSPRSEASVAPSPTVIVVLPTPPFRLSTATRWCPPVIGVRARAVSSRRRRCAADSGARTRPPVTSKIARRHPPDGALCRPGRRRSVVRLSAVTVRGDVGGRSGSGWGGDGWGRGRGSGGRGCGGAGGRGCAGAGGRGCAGAGGRGCGGAGGRGCGASAGGRPCPSRSSAGPASGAPGSAGQESAAGDARDAGEAGGAGAPNWPGGPPEFRISDRGESPPGPSSSSGGPYSSPTS